MKQIIVISFIAVVLCTTASAFETRYSRNDTTDEIKHGPTEHPVTGQGEMSANGDEPGKEYTFELKEHQAELDSEVVQSNTWNSWSRRSGDGSYF